MYFNVPELPQTLPKLSQDTPDPPKAPPRAWLGLGLGRGWPGTGKVSFRVHETLLLHTPPDLPDPADLPEPT